MLQTSTIDTKHIKEKQQIKAQVLVRQLKPDHRTSDCVPRCFNQQASALFLSQGGIWVSAMC